MADLIVQIVQIRGRRGGSSRSTLNASWHAAIDASANSVHIRNTPGKGSLSFLISSCSVQTLTPSTFENRSSDRSPASNELSPIISRNESRSPSPHASFHIPGGAGPGRRAIWGVNEIATRSVHQTVHLEGPALNELFEATLTPKASLPCAPVRLFLCA